MRCLREVFQLDALWALGGRRCERRLFVGIGV